MRSDAAPDRLESGSTTEATRAIADTPRRARLVPGIAGLRRRGRFIDVLICLVLAVAALTFSAKHATGHEDVSPYDEYVYIDYYAKVLHQGVVREGEKTGDFARRYLSCHPNRVFGPWQPQLCAASKNRPDNRYPFAGSTAAGLYSPLYFLSVRLAAEPLIWAGVDFVEAGRLAGGLWLALAVVLLYGALRRIDAPRSLAAGASLAVAGSLAAYWANTYLSTDGTGLAAGAAMLFLVLGYARRPSRAGAAGLLVVAGLFGLMKIQNLEAVAVATLFLVLLAVFDRERPRGEKRSRRSGLTDRRTVVGLGALAVGVVAQGVWLVIRARLALGPDADLNVSTQFAFPSHLLLDMTDFFPGVAQSGLASPELGPWGNISVRVMTLVVAGGVVGVACGRRVILEHRLLASAVFIVALVSGPALSLATLVMNQIYVPVLSRYAVPLLPSMVACAVLLIPWESRLTRFGALATGLFLFGLGLAFQQ